MDEQRHLNLIEAYLDHRLTVEDRKELEALLIQSPTARTLFWSCMQQHAATWELLAEAQGKNLAISESAIRSREQLGLGEPAAGSAAAVVVAPLRNKTRRVGSPVRRASATAGSGRLFWVVTAAMVMLAAGFVVWRTNQPAAAPTTPIPAAAMAQLARLAPAGGLVIHSHGTEPLREGMDIFPGDLIKTGGAGQDAQGSQVRFTDGTTLTLQPASQLTLVGVDQGKALELFSGALTAEVTSQPPGKPLTILTPHATAVVVGTQFTLRVGGMHTRLQVDQGRVRLTRSSDRQSVEVAQAQFVEAGHEGEWTVQSMPPVVAAGDVRHDTPGKDEPRKDEPRHDQPAKDQPRKDEPRKDEHAPHGDAPAANEMVGRITGIAGNKTGFELQVIRAGKVELVGTEVKFVANWVREGDRSGPKEADVRLIRDLRVGDMVRIQYFFEEHYRFVKLQVLEKAPRDIPAPRREPEHKELPPVDKPVEPMRAH